MNASNTRLLGASESLSLQEVKHAPTVEQCRADQRLWLSKLGTNVPAPNTELDNWLIEMGYCKKVDPAFEDRSNLRVGRYTAK